MEPNNLNKTLEIDRLTGEQKIVEKKEKKILQKEEVIFDVDNDGKLIPRELEIEVYDTRIDDELAEESVILHQMRQRHKLTQDIMSKAEEKLKSKINTLLGELSSCENEEKKKALSLEKEAKDKEFERLKETNVTQLKAAWMNVEQSKALMDKLIEQRSNSTKKMYIEAIPLTISEGVNVLEKNRTPDGKETDDWIGDLIVYCCKNPQFTKEEASRMHKNAREAIKRTILELSGYRQKSYRDVLLELGHLENPRGYELKKGSTGE